MNNSWYEPNHRPTLEYFYFMPRDKTRLNLWTSLRKLAIDYPPVVSKRLEWIIFYETVAKKDASCTAQYFNISRKTFHKWHKLFKDSRYKLKSLEDRSKAPKTKRK